ncbi:MAG: Hsp20/alpha crystallin family protein [Dehalococcoidia bacterium]
MSKGGGGGINIDPSAALRQGSGQGSGQALGLGGLFKGIGGLINLVAGMVEQIDPDWLDEDLMVELHRTDDVGRGGQVRGVYGVSMRPVAGGVPRVEQFGNVRQTEQGPVIDEVREPLIDLFDEGDTLLIVAELPGVNEKDIRVAVDGGHLKLSTTTTQRCYFKDLPLPCPIDGEMVKSTYKNGVLKVILCKASV